MTLHDHFKAYNYCFALYREFDNPLWFSLLYMLFLN